MTTQFSQANRFNPVMGKKGQSFPVSGILGMIVLVFIIFTVGRILFNTTQLDPDPSDGGLNSQNGTANATYQNPLTNIGLYTMTGIIIVAFMARIVIGFFL